MPECEKWNQESPSHEENEPTTYELAEMELQEEQKKYLVQEMMQERYYDYFWDEKHAL